MIYIYIYIYICLPAPQKGKRQPGSRRAEPSTLSTSTGRRRARGKTGCRTSSPDATANAGRPTAPSEYGQFVQKFNLEKWAQPLGDLNNQRASCEHKQWFWDLRPSIWPFANWDYENWSYSNGSEGRDKNENATTIATTITVTVVVNVGANVAATIANCNWLYLDPET